MSRLSSDTFFHFTSSEHLIGILENNFYPRYCAEFSCHSDKVEMAYPMVCFCDIPLSQISNHISHYGHYGIGLSREWVIKNRLNPIIYLQDESVLSKKIDGILMSNWETATAVPIAQVINDRDNLIYLAMHTKPYEGTQRRDGSTKSIRFYDEREWRFIPDIKRIGDEELHIIPKNYTKEQIEEKNSLLKRHPLVFQPCDVKYIIIEKEGERSSMIKKIARIKSTKNYGKEEIELLKSKIISVEQIVGDF